MATNSVYVHRISQIQKLLTTSEAVLVSSASMVRYLSGFVSLVESEREGFVLITAQHSYLFHANFSPLPSPVPGMTFKSGSSPLALGQHLGAIKQRNSITKIWVDSDSLTVREHSAVAECIANTCPLLDSTLLSQLQTLRCHKDPAEISAMKKAGQIAATAVDHAIQHLEMGITELELKRLIERRMEDLGADGMAFPSIVGFGAHSALPHYQPNNSRLVPNQAVLIDVGCTVAGYCSDITRTVWFGPKPSSEFSRIEKIVKTAYEHSITLLSEFATRQVLLKDVDSAARSYITRAGYGEAFNHTTGHGLGLDIHEFPSVNWKSEHIVQPNLVITIEPGIYLVDNCGYRFENTILIGNNSILELTSS